MGEASSVKIKERFNIELRSPLALPGSQPRNFTSVRTRVLLVS